MNLLFDLKIGLKERGVKPLIQREAVRAIVINKSRILMLSSNRGDFKLPGGGIKENETPVEALYREVEEETGYRCVKVTGPVGKVFERKIDFFDKTRIFEMNSHYYLCKLQEDKSEQRLTEYEKALDFKPEWLRFDNAIKANYEFLEKHPETHMWTKRECLVLEVLLEYLDQLEKRS